MLLLCSSALRAEYTLSLAPGQSVVARKQTTIAIRLEDSGRPVSDAQLDVVIDMPAMPGMPSLRSRAQSAGGGYEVRTQFPHGGDYRMKVAVTLADQSARQHELLLKVLDLPDQISTVSESELMLAAMGPGGGQSGWFSSGTSQVPRAAPHQMISWRLRDWSIMFHGVAYAVYSNQTGPRGRDKTFAANWIMPMASRRLGPGTLTLRSMLTFEPLTITGRRYPLLFQTGETARGIPIINGQHPHDFLMEVAASYQIPLGERTAINFYGGPRADPALGPPAFPHRLSASENPLAVISHHYQDSTHISSSVITAGITHGPVTWEVSGFHGREPDEKRWGMEIGAINSFATRLTINPTSRWSGQFSIGRINNREVLHPLRDTLRTTASLIYVRPLRTGHWATTLVWGRNHDLAFTQQPGLPPLPQRREFSLLTFNRLRPLHVVTVPTRIPGQIYNTYLFESTLRFRNRNWIWGRIENTDKDTTLLFEEEPFVLLVDERRFARVQLYTAGYSRELKGIGKWLSPSLGGQATLFRAPPQLAPVFGSRSFGMQIILRLRVMPTQ
jgi:hypothetical protein